MAVPAVVPAVDERNKRSLSASSEDSSGSWSQIAPDDDPHEETSSFIQLSEGNGNSSTSSLGLADLEGFSDIPSQSTVNSEEAEKGHLRESKENVDEGISLRSVGGSSSHRELLVVNCDLDPECVDSELRLALQWIAASELGLHAVYFRKCKERRTSKFQRVVQLVSQKAWRIRDLFSAVIQFCKLYQEEEDGGSSLSSLFDWLLETH